MYLTDLYVASLRKRQRTPSYGAWWILRIMPPFGEIVHVPAQHEVV